MRTILGWLGRRSTAEINGVALAILACISVLDYLTPAQISTFVFYVAPISIAAWFGGRTSGVAIALLSAVAWSVKDVVFRGVPYSEPAILFWNSAARLMTFSLMAWLIVRVRLDLHREQQLARLDPLTGLLNASAFREALDAEVARSARMNHRFSVVYIDLDNFKSVNDREGHAEGDRALVAIGEALRHELRRTDTIGRLGGDEFGVILPATETLPAQKLVDELQRRITTAMHQENWPITLSIGAITCHTTNTSADALVQAADRLMYEVKAAGKNAFLHHTWDEPRSSARATPWTRRIRSDLQRSRGPDP